MKIPETFLLRISRYKAGIVSTKFSGQKIKDLLDKVPMNLSFAKNLYNGGRYSDHSEFICNVRISENYNNEVTEIILIFKKIK